MITFACEKCGQQYSLPEKDRGEPFVCECGHKGKVPQKSKVKAQPPADTQAAMLAELQAMRQDIDSIRYYVGCMFALFVVFPLVLIGMFFVALFGAGFI